MEPNLILNNLLSSVAKDDWLIAAMASFRIWSSTDKLKYENIQQQYFSKKERSEKINI